MILRPEGVVTAVPVFWAEATLGATSMAISAIAETTRILARSIATTFPVLKTRAGV
jgi:hypothetical protein